MEYLPASVQRALEGGIDPYTQRRLETYTHVYLAVVVAIAFLVSYATQTVLLPLEIFTAAFVLLCLAVGPAWPYLNKHKHRFLPVRDYVQVSVSEKN